MAIGTLPRCTAAGSTRISGCRSKTARHQGMVKHVDRSKGYGFIHCNELHALFGSDVFVRVGDLLEHDVGDCVSFSLRENKRGQPHGTELKICDEPSEKPCGGDDGSKTSMLGTIKFFDAGRGYGFIDCGETFEKYGRDVFLHKDQLQHFEVGDRVSFCVKANSAGQPQATNLVAKPSTAEWLGDGQCKKTEAVSEPTLSEKYTGRVKNVNDSKACGFIECEDLHKRFGRDVFFPLSLLPGLTIGDHVEFEARVKNGQPQAFSIHRIDVEPRPAPQVSSKAEAPSALDLTKKLLRACASSQKDSYNRMFELLQAGADPNGRDVTGQTALMVAAINVGGSEKKTRLLVGVGADVHTVYKDGKTVLQWAKERLSHKFAAHFEALSRGEQIDCVISLDMVGGPREV